MAAALSLGNGAPAATGIVAGEAEGATDNAVSTAQPALVQVAENASCVANCILVTVEDGVSADSLAAQARNAGVDVQAVSQVSGNVLQISYTGEADPTAASGVVSGLAGVEAAGPDYVLTLEEDEVVALEETTPNDEYFSQQWGLTAVNVQKTWDAVKVQGAVTIALVDSGVDIDHPDLEDNLLLSAAKAFYKEDGEVQQGTNVNDEVGHGTRVAGVMGAVANNSVGVAGVSYNANILPIKVTQKNDSGATTVYSSSNIAAIDYLISLKSSSSSAACKNIDVINMSMGGYTDDKNYAAAINRATQAGMLVVASSGNENKSAAHYPSDYENVLSVGAVMQSSGGGYERWVDSSSSGTGSNYGAGLDIVAPGNSIYTTNIGGGYCGFTGTSAAAPCASAIAALVFTKHPDATPAEVTSMLCLSATDMGDKGRDDYYGYGLIDSSVLINVSFDDLFVEKIPTQQWTGKAITPTPKLKLYGKTLTKGVDYELSYTNNVNVSAGTPAIMTITGKGDYAGAMAQTAFYIAHVLRLAGDDALETMATITRSGFEDGSCSSLIIATMGGYWDALTASGLAGTLNCPVLMTNGSSLSQDTANEIYRLASSSGVTLYISGGTAAVSDNVVKQIRSISGITIKNVVRLAGDDALDTSVKTYEAGSGWGKTCIVSTAGGYWDALSASPYAYANKAPIFLAGAGAKSLSVSVREAIKAGQFTKIIITGGTSAVSSEIETMLKGLVASGGTVERLNGATAVDTSVAIANYCIANGMSTDSVGIATSGSYYDALAGASLCGKAKAALVLVSDSQQQAITSFVGNNAKLIGAAYIFGGTAAVSADTETLLKSTLGM